MIATDNTLRQYRKELTPKVTQERIAQQVGISLYWYGQLENNAGQPTSYTTARAILQAINAERQSRNLAALSLEDLGLTIV